jgi:hypothetical protein
MKNLVYQPCTPIIAYLMSTAAVLPLSTAEVERVFSQVKLVKCDHINRMKQVTMNNIYSDYPHKSIFSVPARISKGQGAGPEKGLFSALLDFQNRHFLGTL